MVALLDEWAARFFEELDYIREGNNGTRFAASMAKDLPQVRAVFGLTVRCAVHFHHSTGNQQGTAQWPHLRLAVYRCCRICSLTSGCHSGTAE